LIVKKENNNIFFILNGEIILQNVEKIKKEIIDVLQKSTDYQNVYINLENVSFIDSSGIGMLVYVNGFLHSGFKVLNLVSPSPDVFKILKVGAFDKLFKIKKQ
jgi:anti-anti-sigma factor